MKRTAFDLGIFHLDLSISESSISTFPSRNLPSRPFHCSFVTALQECPTSLPHRCGQSTTTHPPATPPTHLPNASTRCIPRHRRCTECTTRPCRSQSAATDLPPLHFECQCLESSRACAGHRVQRHHVLRCRPTSHNSVCQMPRNKLCTSPSLPP
jgi:hypothetical protein